MSLIIKTTQKAYLDPVATRSDPREYKIRERL